MQFYDGRLPGGEGRRKPRQTGIGQPTESIDTDNVKNNKNDNITISLINNRIQ